MLGSWENSADHLAPLYKRPFETKDNNVDYIVNYYINNGFPASKIVLGIPLYGQNWELSTGNVMPPASAAGRGAPGPITKQGGILAFNEICVNVRTKGWRVFQDPFRLTGPFAYSPTTPTNWVSYDDPSFAIIKSKFLLSKGLGGAMVCVKSRQIKNYPTIVFIYLKLGLGFEQRRFQQRLRRRNESHYYGYISNH